MSIRSFTRSNEWKIYGKVSIPMKMVKQFRLQRKRDRKRRTSGRRVPRYAGLTVELLESRLLLSAGNLQGDTLIWNDHCQKVFLHILFFEHIYFLDAGRRGRLRQGISLIYVDYPALAGQSRQGYSSSQAGHSTCMSSAPGIRAYHIGWTPLAFLCPRLPASVIFRVPDH